MMKSKVLGLDPGTIRMGFAVIGLEKEQLILQDLGVIEGGKTENYVDRLLVIGGKLEQLYQKYSPSETAVEKVFFGKNADSAFKLGQIFGICSYQASRYHSQFFSYATRFVKQSVTGMGGADKQTVKNFISNWFSLPDLEIPLDATDALAVALCHVFQKQRPHLLGKQL